MPASRIQPLLLMTAIASVAVTCQAARADNPDRDRRRSPVVIVFEKCRDAVVNISTTRVISYRSLRGSAFDSPFYFGLPPVTNRRVQSVGSGVVVHESGLIVTNAHVVAQASDVRITFADGTERPARPIAVDTEHDLAILKVEAPGPLAVQPLGRSDDIMIGETVIAIGNPLGLQHTVTQGIVSALDRTLEISEDVVHRGLIQTDAPINPGNSGGPLLNVNGELIGINTAIRGDAQNIGFAIPVDRLGELLPNMLDIERRQRVRLGLTVDGTAAVVTAVRSESPAAAAGLRPGDCLVGFNGHPLRNGMDYYVALLDQQPEAELRLDVRRGDVTRAVTVKLEAIPLPDGERLARELFGVLLVEVTPDVRRRFDLPAYAGLIVAEVERGSPAQSARLRSSDLILRVERVPVTSLQELGLVLEQVKPGERLRIEGLRIDANPPFFWTLMMPTRSTVPRS